MNAEGVDLGVGHAVRALVVVVKDELPEHPVEMALTADKRTVQALGPRGPNKAFGGSVCFEAPGLARGGPEVKGAKMCTAATNPGVPGTDGVDETPGRQAIPGRRHAPRCRGPKCRPGRCMAQSVPEAGARERLSLNARASSSSGAMTTKEWT
jgi:hypothetical protein